VHLLLTGYSEIESIISAFNHGKIHQYIQKYWDNDEILLTIEQKPGHKEFAERNQITKGKNHIKSVL
jgi:response regulator RpfG family c-di-GMP phosphodiesterase